MPFENQAVLSDPSAENAAAIVHRATEVIAENAAAVINAALERFGVEYRVRADDARLVDEAVSLAAAHDAAYRHDVGMDAAFRELAKLDQHLADLVDRRNALAGVPSLAPSQAHQLGLIEDEIAAVRSVAIRARVALAEVDNGSHAEAVARGQAALERAQHGIVSAAVVAHVDAAEAALVAAVAAFREINRIGVKHLGADIEAYIPSPAVAELVGGFVLAFTSRQT